MNVSKEARLAISKAASVFVLYATSWYVRDMALYRIFAGNLMGFFLFLNEYHFQMCCCHPVLFSVGVCVYERKSESGVGIGLASR